MDTVIVLAKFEVGS